MTEYKSTDFVTSNLNWFYMKTKLRSFFFMLALNASVYQTSAQLPIITSLSQNGQLICSNLLIGSTASVEWASSLSGPWYTNWNGLDAVIVSTNGNIQVGVPMFYRVHGIAAPANMCLIPGGTFTMGDILDGESDAIPTNVFVSAFYMDANLVNYGQWQSVYIWGTNNKYGFDNVGSGKASNHPVQTVNWYDVVKWSNARSQQAGLTPVYYTDAEFTLVYTNGDFDTIYPNWAANGFRLPTEAEWEKAARGGLNGNRFPWGNTISESQANYEGDTNNFNYDLGSNGYNVAFNDGVFPYTSPVGSFAANGYGLKDMAGNVFEWCWDWYGTPYGQISSGNPTGPAIGNARVERGGSWSNVAGYARCACRAFGYPNGTDQYVGFRCVRAH